MLRSTLSSWREYLTPVSHKSTFLSSGQITPDEFVQAGDYLCHMFPTWEWNKAGNDVLFRNFLPEDKQFLVMRKVPCNVRAKQFVNIDDSASEAFVQGINDEDGSIENGWMIGGGETDHLSKHSLSSGDVTPSGNNTKTMDETTPDIDDLMESMGIEDTDDIIDTPQNTDRRYYDLYITYSTSYKVPKMYIVGFNGSGSPLTPEEMFEDIAPDYRSKTATIEKLPFYKNTISSVSIHPCKHANVMRILLDKVLVVKRRRREEMSENHNEHKPNPESDEWEDLQNDVDDTIRADQYLIIFLKFITSVTPGIEHDYTMEGW
ncbi:hypothetical protein Kpol_1060p18 [Vanderwaltozyma polyspora DSM 70294]|uniref:Autophagy-related protein 3 n=1 Tax=Vanderwaltozyma polyspora (strain ATCC 22028 / DSM 70294 / BCRC 21397 / CBS 2163 / NBRC 10782 / NRRL Y-8283 / UCD 57-17) TaxID=436907 RepID=ATG3_VANPO|nr:uncharacterized protein Kpol_1060p18 [Vanderwaltozyma polyspora DSM 70294]A7TK16.1 RecName: Full=Autophagy-related protein 3; AltName: Full=Autophagy-related E2-like conjugation enzyme ATG3 [Vanderwaltozyma polyspora DSM 70294]EDO17362.1 hypothetical protein Kpol_1060p18 [Vanderwaltozyma polyspora DSM 70294]